MSDVDLRQLRYLVAVADEGGITRAAERLTMTQPALSRAIATLERAVGVPLVERRPRGTVLTEAGEVLAERARAIDRQVSSAVWQARETGDGAPPIRISARACEFEALQELIRGFTAAHPGQRAEAVMADWRTQLSILRSGGTELALVSGEVDDEGLDSAVLAVHERLAVLPAGHKLADRETVDRAELLPDPVIGWADSPPAERDYVLDLAPLAGPEVEDLLQLVVQIRTGSGIAFLSQAMLDEIPRLTGVAVVRVEGLAPARLQLLWPEQQTSTAVARFVQHATA
ncbi:LysR family transcriptional regulator [Streptomyces aurantiacus]|uniref:LysR family transcriptional regulator n=1 Tax=Streptomyces aurantiacus TaxID=47760 RepID=UPI0007C6B07F|nr:LysR family transcriptional regulator [Streptomyces aurantiacus]